MYKPIYICQPLKHREDSLRDWWLAFKRAVDNETPYFLLRNGRMSAVAFLGEKTDEQMLRDEDSAWCATKEECIELCIKHGYEYLIGTPGSI